MDKKRGQMQIGFGVIFSVILIIIFIAFAIYGITKFLEVQKLAQIAGFENDFQGDIDTMYGSTSGSQPVSYIIPKKIEQVCFVYNSNENMYFIPNKYSGALLKNVDIPKTVVNSTSRPKKLCIDTLNGKISMTIKKGYNEDLVTITK